MDERLSWDKHTDSIYSKLSWYRYYIGAMRWVKPFVPMSTTKMLLYSLISISAARYGIFSDLVSKIGCKITKIVLQE
jgi:hypothetical protein